MGNFLFATLIHRKDMACVVPILLSLVLQACDLTEPPGRTYNDKVSPPVVKVLSLPNLEPYQHVGGVLTIAFTVDTLADQVQTLYLLIDSSIVQTWSAGASTMLQVDTRYWPEGPHVLMIALQEAHPHTGLIGVAGVPTVMYGIPLVFDQTAPPVQAGAPTTVHLLSLTWDNGAPMLRWTQNSDAVFRSYRIWRGGNWAMESPNIFDYGAMRGVDSVTAQSGTSYRDAAIPQLIGLNLRYAVCVSNGMLLSSMSDTLSITYGNAASLPYGDILTPRPVWNPREGLLYAVGGDTLISFDVQTHSRRATTTLTTLPRTTPRLLALNQDGTLLFVLGWAPTLTVVNPANLSILSSYQLNSTWTFGQSVWCEGGLSNRIYIGTQMFGNSLKVIDGQTGSVVEEPVFPSNGFNSFLTGPLAMSPDRSTLFAFIHAMGGTVSQDTVYRLDVTKANLKVVARRPVVGSISQMQVSPDGARLLVLFSGTSAIEVWDATSLSSLSSMMFPTSVVDMVVGSSSLFISRNRSSGMSSLYNEVGSVEQYTIGSSAPVGAWDFVGVPGLLQVSGDERSVLALSNLYYFGKQWWEIRK